MGPPPSLPPLPPRSPRSTLLLPPSASSLRAQCSGVRQRRRRFDMVVDGVRGSSVDIPSVASVVVVVHQSTHALSGRPQFAAGLAEARAAHTCGHMSFQRLVLEPRAAGHASHPHVYSARGCGRRRRSHVIPSSRFQVQRTVFKIGIYKFWALPILLPLLLRIQFDQAFA